MKKIPEPPRSLNLRMVILSYFFNPENDMARNTSFLHEAAGRICLGIDMLKPLSLWRCASAYNAMMVNNKAAMGIPMLDCQRLSDDLLWLFFGVK